MSCLFQRHNGFFYVVTPGKGRRVWKSLRTRDESEARQAFHEIESEQQRKTSLTVRLCAEDFLSRARLSLSEKTVSMHGSALKNLIRLSGDRALRKVTSLHVEAFKQERAQEVSPVSVNIELRSLRAAFGEAQRLGLIGQNPFTGARQLRVPHVDGKYLSEHEFSFLLGRIQDPFFGDMITFAVFTMMRLGEIVNLRWADVDLDRKEIHVRSCGNFRVKGGRPRIVPMSKWVYMFLRNTSAKGEHVFQYTNGKPMTTRAVSRRFKKYVRIAGLDDGLHFHSLRHSGISWLMNKGIAPQFVQRIAGHSSLNVTRVYTHLEDKNLVSAVNAFGPLPTNQRIAIQ